MQPNEVNENPAVAPQEPVIVQPQAAAAPPPPPPPPAPYTQQQSVQTDTTYRPASSVGYVGTLKALMTNPKEYLGSSQTLVQSIIFSAVNLVVMIVVTMLTTVIAVLTMHTYNGDTTSPFSRLTGDFWGQIFKSAGLSSLYAALFLFAVAGIVLVVSLIKKRQPSFNDTMSISSIFSLNFLAVALASIVGLLAVWINNTDFSSIILLISSMITGLVFIYSMILIVQGVSDISGLSLITSVALVVVSTALLIFVGGKIVKGLTSDINVSFGGYNNSVSSAVNIMTALRNSFDSLSF